MGGMRWCIGGAISKTLAGVASKETDSIITGIVTGNPSLSVV